MIRTPSPLNRNEMMRPFLATIALAIFFAPATALAQSAGADDSLHVIVGPGARTLEPIAIPDAVCVGASQTACGTVTAVMRRDMLLSFFFKVLTPRSYLVDPASEPVDGPKWNDWVNTGARYLIKAQVKGPAPYSLVFRLYNVTGNEVVPAASKTFTGISERALRRTTHKFCNAVLGAVTGTPGVFDTRMAFTSKVAPGVKSIGVVGMDGHGRGGLVSNGSINMLPSWGFGALIYTSFRGGKPDIYFGKKRLSKDAGHYRKAAVSPNGSSIVVSISYGGQSDLYLMGKDGTVRRNLTNSPSDEVSPTFSPDGSKVAFVSSAAGGPQIYVMSVGGGGVSRLTHAGKYNYSPDWGPGGLIAFAGLDEGASDLFTVTEGGQIARLTQDQGSNKDPSWSPDGRYISFVSHRPAGSGIYLMSADGRYQLMISKGGGAGNLAWQR
jgi:TolB protein